MTPARGHMPFPGHRTIGEMDRASEAARRRALNRSRAMEFGLDPDALLPKRSAG